MSRALRIGLTGGIGSGKSTVAGLLRARGAHIVDTDAIAHRLTAPGGRAAGAGGSFKPCRKMWRSRGAAPRQIRQAFIFLDLSPGCGR